MEIAKIFILYIVSTCLTWAMLPNKIKSDPIAYPIAYNYFICYDNDRHKAAQFNLSGKSKFLKDVMIECNYGEGDSQPTDCRKVIYYKEQKILTIDVFADTSPLTPAITQSFPVRRQLILDKATSYSGSIQFENGLGHEIALYKKDNISQSNYKISVITYSGKPMVSTWLSQSEFDCQQYR